MKRNQFAFLLAAVTLVLASCSSKGPEYARHIPKTAAYVISLDVKSMMIKLDQDSLSMENMLAVMKSENNTGDYTEALDMWAKFKDAGLDFEGKVLIAVPSYDIEAGKMSFQLVAGVQDAAKLDSFVAKLPNAPKVEKQGDLKLISTPDFTMGWNKETVMMVGTQGADNYGMMDIDSTAPAAIPGAADNKGLVQQYFSLKKDESIAGIDEFQTLMEQQADVAIFANNSAVSGTGANPMMAMMPKVKELLDGIYSTTTLNFENGKIEVKSQSFAGPRMAALLKKYAGPVADMSLLERYPNGNINGATLFSFKPELLPALLKETGLDALVNLAIAEGGTNLDDVTKAFKGDFAIVFSDFEVRALDMGKDAKYTSYEPAGKLLVAVRIGDKKAFDNILAFGEKQNILRRQGNRILPGGDEMAAMATNRVFAGVEKDLLIFATDSVTYSQYAAAATKASVNPALATAMKGKAVGFFVDVASILKGIPDAAFDSTDVHEKNILTQSKVVFKDMWFNTDNFDGKKVSGAGEVTMATGKNALPQLVRFLMYVAEEMKAKEQEEEAMYQLQEARID